jgi:ubiquinone/menaquinone biosynthesis C-methylase UbiE
MNVVEAVHGRKVLGRRFRVLSEQVSQLIPPESSVLDIGCGSGDIDKLILERRKDVTISGIDVLVRQDTAIEVTEYDGSTLPCDDNSYDAVIFVDVLHHTDNIERLLAEAGRVAGKCVILKDHTMEGLFSKARLNFMDRVGNRRFGVNLTYNYYTKKQWLEAFEKAGLAVDVWNTKLDLYPWPFSMVFDSGLHFVARLLNKEQH